MATDNARDWEHDDVYVAHLEGMKVPPDLLEWMIERRDVTGLSVAGQVRDAIEMMRRITAAAKPPAPRPPESDLLH